MIARTSCTIEAHPQQISPTPWQQQLADALQDPAQLIRQLQLPESLLEAAQRAAQLFPLKVPQSFLQRIQPGNPQDPLLLQVLPLHAETMPVNGYSPDPLQEQAATKQTGLLHKYAGRVLLIASSACAINCRYCFRRHFPYADNLLGSDAFSQVIDYVAADTSIDEVILSGGDPLVMSDRRIEALISQLQAIPHLQRLRIHTRLPIVIPQRVTTDLLNILANTRLQTLMVVHSNHAQEIDAEVAGTLQRLRHSGITMLNQAVLLRGINNRVDTLEQLSRRLFDAGVLPYYLHLLDPVAGAAHFDCREDEAVPMLRELSKRLPGYLVPRLVREEAGQPSKTLIASTGLLSG